MTDILTTASKVIDAFGGNKEFAAAYSEATGILVDPARVYDWKRLGFPAHTYIRLRPFLDAKELRVADSAWNMHRAKRRKRQPRRKVAE